MTVELKKVKVSAIKPYGKNPRKNDKAAEEVAKSIEQCGYCNPIIVDEDMVVLAGHTRLKALKILGWKACDVLVISGLSEDQKRKYRLYDNKTGELATWDYDKLAEEIADLDFSGFDLSFDIPVDEPLSFGESSDREVEEKDEFDYTCWFCGFKFDA